MLTIGKKSKIVVEWNVSPYDYTKDKRDEIIAKMAKKYGIPKSSVKVIPNLIMPKGTDSADGKVDVVRDIQDEAYQLSLFKDYLEEMKIDGYDFDLIKKIDAEMNSMIDYKSYEKYGRYSIKWVKWSNFLSYGEDNFFDFTHLGKMVLVNGEPANQSGKTTFAIDLIHFLLFGKVGKYKTQDKIFNKHLQNATNVTVEGCLSIGGEDYIIKRTLTRPSALRRTSKSATTQKVEYFKVVDGEAEELKDVGDELQGEKTSDTNAIIKASIGNEEDFDLAVSVTETNLDELIDKKDADRGRLLSRWIGLLPIEEKDAKARAFFNGEVKPKLMSNIYNKQDILQEKESFDLMAKAYADDVAKYGDEIVKVDKDIASLSAERDTLSQAKGSIDDGVMRIDIETLRKSIEKVVADGKAKAELLASVDDSISKIGDVPFSNEAFDNANERFSNVKERLASMRVRYKTESDKLQHYKTSEYCPTCHRKLDGVDNSAIIAETQSLIDALTKEGKELSKEFDSVSKEVESMKEMRLKYEEKNKLSMRKSALEAQIVSLRSDYRDLSDTMERYKANKEAIDKNNKIEMSIRNLDARISSLRATRDTTMSVIASKKKDIEAYSKQSEERTKILAKMEKEETLVKNWKIYLDLVGKNGIVKMLLRKVIPVINGRLASMLGDICDFSVEVSISPKNEVLFYLCKDGVYSDLSGASGFERTAAALALRSVLSSLSTIPRMNFFVADEIMGRVARPNYEGFKNLLDKICEDYDFILNITHLDEFKDFCDTEISVVKENNVSKIILK